MFETSNLYANWISNIKKIGLEIFESFLFMCCLMTNITKSIEEIEEVKDKKKESIYKWLQDEIFDIAWKYCEIQTIITDTYKTTIVPKFHNYTNNYFLDEIYCIKDKEITKKIKKYEEIKENLENELEENDFIIRIVYDLQDKNYAKVILNNEVNDNFNKSSVNFIVLELEYNKEKYEIDLRNPLNYLIEGNVLECNFFRWYMKDKYNIDIVEEFVLRYMKGDCVLNELSSPFYIKFTDTDLTGFSILKKREE